MSRLKNSKNFSADSVEIEKKLTASSYSFMLEMER